MQTQVWTAASVRRELPECRYVMGTIDGGEIAGRARITGRKEPFATVVPVTVGDRVIRVHNAAEECSWETLANCLNNDRPVRL